MSQTFVYDNVEVRQTGRTAQKELRSKKIDRLVEVTPLDPMVGSWKKWVREAELFEVQPDE